MGPALARPGIPPHSPSTGKGDSCMVMSNDPGSTPTNKCVSCGKLLKNGFLEQCPRCASRSFSHLTS